MIGDAQGVGTITNDDVAAPSLTAASTTVSPGSVITFTVANGPGNGWDWVALHRTTDPDATFVDWVYLSGTRTQPAPGVTSATIQLTAPAIPGTYHARLFANNTYTKLATSNVVTAPAFSISDVTVAEGQSGTSVATFTVTLAPANGAATVAYATANGSATSGTDYTAASGTLSFAAGVATQTINVTIAGDAVIEPTEAFVVNLSNATNAAISDAQGVGTITNDDLPPPSITAASATVNPGSVITFTIANAPGLGWDWVALYRTTDPDATIVDWLYLSGTRTAPAPGVTSTTIQLTAPAAPGTYHARLFANNTYTTLATSNVVTVALPSITPAAATVSPGGVISVTVANGPGNGWDWVALHSTTAPDWTFVDWAYSERDADRSVTGRDHRHHSADGAGYSGHLQRAAVCEQHLHEAGHERDHYRAVGRPGRALRLAETSKPRARSDRRAFVGYERPAAVADPRNFVTTAMTLRLVSSSSV